jgi:glycosyltransferase involved in cell wall biosynthesis
VLEAAIARLPIICTSVCGAAADLVRDGENGYCIPSRDPRSIAHAIRLLTTLPAETRRLWGERSHALALPYDVTAWSDTLFSLVKDLHGERMATRAGVSNEA